MSCMLVQLRHIIATTELLLCKSERLGCRRINEWKGLGLHRICQGVDCPAGWDPQRTAIGLHQVRAGYWLQRNHTGTERKIL
eukprot:4765406-Amphidinium_carterae.1